MERIPHIIHYCWFGKNPKNRKVKKYIKGWKKKLPGYTFMEWNEDNFPIEDYPFAKQAYEAGKFAFVSDVARVYALREHGGVYLDTDIEVVRDFSECIDMAEMVLGAETEFHYMTAFIAAVPHHPVIEEMLAYYKEQEFKPVNGSYEPLVNTKLITRIVKEEGYDKREGTRIYSEEYFSAYEFYYEKRLLTENTYTVHHFSGSWMPFAVRFRKFCKKVLRIVLGDKVLRKLLPDKK